MNQLPEQLFIEHENYEIKFGQGGRLEDSMPPESWTFMRNTFFTDAVVDCGTTHQTTCSQSKTLDYDLPTMQILTNCATDANNQPPTHPHTHTQKEKEKKKEKMY